VATKRAFPGAYPLRREVIEHHQRERILVGAAKAISEQGYRQTSVSDIVRRAAIARGRFYENFSSKQDCFFALYDEAAKGAMEVVSAACAESDADFPGRVNVSLEALLRHLAAHAVLARAFIVESPAVGPPITSRFEALIKDFATLLRDGRPDSTAAELPDTVEETVIGGLYWLLYYAFLDEPPKRIEKLLPQLTEFSLLPFLGAEAARSAVASG
jgi:AcrR family transcriptional regulator